MESLIANAISRTNDINHKSVVTAKPTLFMPPQQAIKNAVKEPVAQPAKAAEPSEDFSEPEAPVARSSQKQNYDDTEFKSVGDAKIMVVGCGGMGTNAINRLYHLGISGAATIAINTDKKHLLTVSADKKILIGRELTRGLGAGGYPAKGRQAAEESGQEIKKAVEGCDMVFIVGGMGGGTGTGSAPVVAKIAKSLDAIVIGVVTMPFKIEGGRISKAEEGLASLRQVCDTVIVIENDKLLEIAGEMPLQQAFAVADEIIVTMIKGITETISTPSLVNLDYADVKAVMSNGGVAVIGVGESNSAARAREAVEEAMSNPLLDVDFHGATGALIHISGGPDMKLSEINEIGEFVAKHLDTDAQTIWGARINENLEGRIRVITIITGVHSQYVLGRQEEHGSKDPKQNLGNTLGIRMV